MFCVIKYIDYEEFIKEKQIEEIEIENKELLINPDCPIGILRDYISNELQLTEDQSEKFELCTEKAALLDTRNAPPTQQGIDILRNREIYYIILEPNERGDICKVLTPLLGPFTNEYLEFMSQQIRKSSSGKLRRKSSLKVFSANNVAELSSK